MTGKRKTSRRENLGVVDLVVRIFVAFFASGTFPVGAFVNSPFTLLAHRARVAIRDTLIGMAPSKSSSHLVW